MMKNVPFDWQAELRLRQASMVALSLLALQLSGMRVNANPTGGTVSQGAASFSSSGSTFTINSTTANTFINWQSFNIASGETTIFNEPSSSSLVWNQINDSNPSQILGNLNANGYVILQNQHGFYVGGNAAISAHGLVMTTSPTPAPTLSSGGAWEFDTPPPSVPIINYGKITIKGGGQAYLIADNIQNYGTISAEQGKIGLYAGKQVLLSTSPDGRGINVKVTLPQGSVDNEGNLIADGGTIAALAQSVNQNGLVQANSVKNVNGTIELVASDSLNLGANSVISANGDNSGVSSGGSVSIKSDNTFSDQAGSTINIGGGAQGGNGGTLEISAPILGVIQSQIQGHAADGFLGGALTIDPTDITLDAPTVASYNQMIASGGLSQFSLMASDDITFDTVWSLALASVSSTLSLSAGNSIIFNDGTGLSAGQNWSLNLMAGTAFTPTTAQPTPPSGSYGVYLNGSAYVQTQNGDINVSAANEVLINPDTTTAGGNGIRTLNGGSIDVTTQYGDVNTGGNTSGFVWNNTGAPYYTASQALGGISTVAGGNVTISAGGSVYSYIPLGIAAGGTTWSDAGTGAFGPEPGNVTIMAGGGVYGHYVLANGVGTLTAQQGNVGDSSGSSFALSLIDGSWSVNAPQGNIYLQEVRNPNGDFNNLVGGRSNPGLAGQYLYNYGSQDAVDLNAGMGVYLTGINVPRNSDSLGSSIPVLYPSILNITAGSGGVTLDANVTLFPSPYQDLAITTTGNLVSSPNVPGTIPELLMSDSSQLHYGGAGTFGDTDHGSLLNEPTASSTPASLDIAGNMENIYLITTKATEIFVGGNMINCGFSGQNLGASDVTSITVNGQIYNQSAYAFAPGDIQIPNLPSADVPLGVANTWNTIFLLAVNPATLAGVTIPTGTPQSQWLDYILQTASVFGVTVNSSGQLVSSGSPNFVYNTTTGQLGYGGPMTPNVLSGLSGSLDSSGNPTGNLTILRLVNGVPVLGANGHFETDTVTWVSPSILSAMYQNSQADPSPTAGQLGYRLGGPGQFDVNAGSISLGNTYGILSCGASDTTGGFNRYNNLASVTSSGGASVNVTVSADQTGTITTDDILSDGTALTIGPHASLDMLTSTIATLGGGDVNINSLNGSLDLGTEELFNTQRQVGFGVFTAGEGNVNVYAQGNINIDGSRIAAYNGGNIFIESYGGNVDVGSGGDTFTGVYLTYVAGGVARSYAEAVFGSGIVANTLVPSTAALGYPPAGASVTVAKVPGNITVLTPKGNISSTLGGITQEALDGTTTAGPTIDLEAGTAAADGSPGYIGNIDLGQSGVIGGSVTLKATGNITGLIISRQNSTVQAAQNFNGTVLAGGNADVSGASVAGVIVGVGGATVTGANVSATVLSQNANVNNAASSTLGSSASATSTSASAAQQASADTKQEVASNGNGNDDDKKKKKGALIQRVKRVTVILPQKA